MIKELGKYKDARNEINRFSAVNNILITHLEEGYSIVETDIDDDKLNPNGTAHGGCIFTMCDNAAGSAAASLDNLVATVDANIHYLRPILRGTHVIAEGRVIKAGKKVITCSVTVKDSEGVELACGIFTFMCLKETFSGFKG